MDNLDFSGGARPRLRILLVRPPARFSQGTARPSVSLPLGLLCIAAVLEKHRFDVGILDGQVDPDNPLSPGPDGSLHMGRSWFDFEAAIRERSPDVVGITCQFTTQLDNAIRAAGIVKGIGRRIVTVVGGNHPSVRPGDFFLKTDAVDVVCMGEGEYTMLDIAAALRDGRDPVDIPGTAVRDREGIREDRTRLPIDKLDELPFPAYHLVNMEDYFLLHRRGFTDRPGQAGGTERAVSVVTSRGCPFNCVFCSIHLHMGRKWRGHSVEYVLDHVAHLRSRYGVGHVHFEDDNISASAGRFRSLLEGLIDGGNRLTWDTPNGVRVDTLTEEIVALCKRSRCVYLIFGVESGNQRTLSEIIEKKLDLPAVVRAAAWCRDAALDAMSFFVIGFPGESVRAMQDTVDFALQLHRDYDVSPGLFVATPLPGTRLEKILMEMGLLGEELSPDALAKMTQGAFVMDGDGYKAADVLRMRERFLKGYKMNFIRNFGRFLAKNPRAIPALLRTFSGARKRMALREALLDVYVCKNFLGGTRPAA